METEFKAHKQPIMRYSNKTSDKKRQSSLKNKIQATAEDLLDKVQRLPAKHERVNEAFRAINSQGKCLGMKLSPNSKTKLLALYNTALKQCQSEHSTLKSILADIQKIRQSNFEAQLKEGLSRGSLMVLLSQHAHSLPLYAGAVEGHPPPLVGAIPMSPGMLLEKGDFVAAFVEDVWILAYIEERVSEKKYIVHDVDDDGDVSQIIPIPMNRIIPLPKYRADPRRDVHALFPRDAIVLALYPQTTCFYKGVVENSPSKPSEDYYIAFEDATFPRGYSPTLPVPQRYVVAYSEVGAAVRNSGGDSKRGRRRVKEELSE